MNKVIVSGRLTKDPEIRYTQAGTAVCSFTVAVDRRFSKKNENQQTVDFIPVVCWQKLAEICGNNLTKGRKVIVEGRLQVRTYDAQDGTKRYVTEVVAGEVEFVDYKKDEETKSNTDGYGSTVPDEDIPF